MHVCVLTLYIILVFFVYKEGSSKTHPSFFSIKFFLKSTRPSFFDKAGCTRQFESELSLRSFAQLFPIKEGSFENPPVLPYP